MVNMNPESARPEVLPESANTGKVRKVIEDVCAAAGTSVAIDERLGGEGAEQRLFLHMTYNGERPVAHAQWVKLVDSIDSALDPLEVVDWEFSELSEESDNERMAAWAIVPAT